MARHPWIIIISYSYFINSYITARGPTVRSPSAYGCDYEDPRCGVFVIAKHPAGHIDVGEILATGDYNATSQNWPAGTPTAASAFANGAFFMQMAASPDGKSGLSVVECTLPGGTLSSAPLDEGYTIQTMVFDEGRGSLVAIVSKEPPVTAREPSSAGILAGGVGASAAHSIWTHQLCQHNNRKTLCSVGTVCFVD